MSVHRYTWTAIALHWLVAALLVVTFPLAVYMTGLPLSPHKLQLYAYHKWIGVTVFILALLRLVWRLTHRPPPHDPALPAWRRGAADASHALMYVLLLAAPLTGWLYSSAVGVPTVYLGVWQLPDLLDRNRELADVLKVAHKTVVVTLAAIVGVHLAAALQHHYVHRNAVLKRMAPFVARRKGGRA
jgi:cytochrome b561